LVSFWLNFFFFLARYCPWLARPAKSFFLFFVIRFSRQIRVGTRINARRILGPSMTDEQARRFTRGVIASFYDFIHDVGRSLRETREQMLAHIEAVEGQESYIAARQSGKGAIVVTAHMGSFELGVAALLEREPRVHVVFKRDNIGRFESIRSEMRRRLGVIEAPVDDGWGIWMTLRNALLANEVVVIQGDRVMPNQKGQPAPFLGGHLLLPTGPVKLALASGAPIIPIFSIRGKNGKLRVIIENPILVSDDNGLPGEPHPALIQLAAVIEKYVRAFPEQWLMLEPALCEDAELSASKKTS
jgi:KDO2-lipid IV(A) lauroyltransferase